MLGENPSAAQKRATALPAERIKERAGVALAGPGDKAAFRLVPGKVALNAKIKGFAAAHNEVAPLGADGYVIAVDPENKGIHFFGILVGGVGTQRRTRDMWDRGDGR
jgi:hypothetical protein